MQLFEYLDAQLTCTHFYENIFEVDPLFGDDDEDDMFKVAPIKNLSTTRPSKPATSSKPIPPSKPKVNWSVFIHFLALTINPMTYL